MKDYQHREPEISMRSIEKMHKNITVKIAEPNRINCYSCGTCGYIMKTIDRHEGTTPMLETCIKCNRIAGAISSWYKDIAPDIPVTHEYVVPNLKTFLKYRRNPDMIDHFCRGGLDLQLIKKP